eukprot:NODE_106_length_19857_cov_0.799980.p4 type:complete len:425 gc:universal NODE_106_length_19857_cov_0.799980:13494-14768(+)
MILGETFSKQASDHMELELLSMEYEHVEMTSEDIIDKFLSLSCPKIDEVIKGVIDENQEYLFSKLQSNPSNFTKVIINNKEFCSSHFTAILNLILPVNLNKYPNTWPFLIKTFPHKSLSSLFPYLNDDNIVGVMDPICKFALEDGVAEEVNSYGSGELILISSIRESLVKSNLFFSILHQLPQSPKFLKLFKHVTLFYPDLLQILISARLSEELVYLFDSDVAIAVDFCDLICQKIAYKVIDMRNNVEQEDFYIHTKTLDVSNEFLSLVDEQTVPILVEYLLKYDENSNHITYNTYIDYNPLTFRWIISLRFLHSVVSKSTSLIRYIHPGLWKLFIGIFAKHPYNTQFHSIFYDLIKLAPVETLSLVFVKLEFIKYLVVVKNRDQGSDAAYFMNLICKYMSDRLQQVPEICDCYGWEELLSCIH